VIFACDDVPERPLPATGKGVGIDLGLTAFAALSNGEMVEHPRAGRAASARVRQASRRVAKKKRGGANRQRAVRRLAKHHRKVANVRRDFAWKLARSLVERFDVIAVEDLNVKGLAGGMLAKAVRDAGWADFLNALTAEAESAGREVVRVDPSGTSQACSGCGCEVRKTLAIRIHDCPHCGLVMDRDENAARNIAQVGRVVSRLRSQAAA
jgi:putative transposase